MPAILLQIAYDLDTRTKDDLFKLKNGYDGDAELGSIAMRLLKDGGYWAVGAFASDDPEEIWKITQNGVVSPSWSRQPPEGVKPLGSGTIEGLGYRSSDVGDIVVVDGACHLVAAMGFHEIGPLPSGLDNMVTPDGAAFTDFSDAGPSGPGGPR